MKRKIPEFSTALALVLLAAPPLFAVKIDSKAREIEITGRVHTQFNTSSVEGELASEFITRRARLTAEVELNDFVSGKVQPDYGEGKMALKDAYMKLDYRKGLSFRVGQFHRPFDLFELTSSTKILVVERALKIRGVHGMRSLSSLTEKLGYSDRDIGVEAKFHGGRNRRVSFAAAITNGTGANKVPAKTDGAVGEKQYTGRLEFKPAAGRAVKLALSGSLRPYTFTAGTDTLIDASKLGEAADTTITERFDQEYAYAIQGDLELGDFKGGPHVQAGAVYGQNWKERLSDASGAPRFFAAQVIGSVKIAVERNEYVQAVEPLLRLSYADPNDDLSDDGGILVTPGVQFFFTGRNKIALNLDLFLPESSDEGTEYSFKAQSSLHF